jgi:hypothetical protein
MVCERKEGLIAKESLLAKEGVARCEGRSGQPLRQLATRKLPKMNDMKGGLVGTVESTQAHNCCRNEGL